MGIESATEGTSAYFVRHAHSPKILADFNGDPYGISFVIKKAQKRKRVSPVFYIKFTKQKGEVRTSPIILCFSFYAHYFASKCQGGGKMHEYCERRTWYVGAIFVHRNHIKIKEDSSSFFLRIKKRENKISLLIIIFVGHCDFGFTLI